MRDKEIVLKAILTYTTFTKIRRQILEHDLWPWLLFNNFLLFSQSRENTAIILSKHTIALLIHILLSMSLLIKGEAAAERYHAHWLEIGGLNNQAKIKGRLCFRVSPFALIKTCVLEWALGWGQGWKGKKGCKQGRMDVAVRHSSGVQSQYLFSNNRIRSKGAFWTNSDISTPICICYWLFIVYSKSPKHTRCAFHYCNESQVCFWVTHTESS